MTWQQKERINKLGNRIDNLKESISKKYISQLHNFSKIIGLTFFIFKRHNSIMENNGKTDTAFKGYSMELSFVLS